jgi:peptidoglycan-N-acetylglucosamine deacetylase
MRNRQIIQLIVLLCLILIFSALFWFDYTIFFPKKPQLPILPPQTNQSTSMPEPEIEPSKVTVKEEPPKESVQVYGDLAKAEKVHEWLMAMEKCHGITSIHTNKKVIALTFDDGPNGKYTENILKILNDHQIRATFFLIGENALHYPELVKTLLANQHVIGNHTLEHRQLSNLRDEQVTSELKKTNAIIYRVSGVIPALFRPPYGMCSDSSAKITKELGYKTITWKNSTDDYAKKNSAENIAADIIKRVHPGQIIALHDGGGNRAKTVAALPIIIDELQKRGYQFVTVPELLHVKPYQVDIVDNIVQWGYKETIAKIRPIDTLVIYATYNSLDNDPHSINGILQEYAYKNITPHYLINREGIIYRLVTDETIAYHSTAAEINKYAIGIAIINGQNKTPTKIQYMNLAHLIKALQSIYKITYIIGANQIPTAPNTKSQAGLKNFDWTNFKTLLGESKN